MKLLSPLLASVSDHSLLVIGAFLVASAVALLWYAIKSAPMGFQDERGFHRKP